MEDGYQMIPLWATLFRRGNGDWKVRDTGKTTEEMGVLVTQEGWERDGAMPIPEKLGGQFTRVHRGEREWLRVQNDRYIRREIKN